MMTNPNPPSAEETLKKLLGDYIREDFRRSTMMTNPNQQPTVSAERVWVVSSGTVVHHVPSNAWWICGVDLESSNSDVVTLTSMLYNIVKASENPFDCEELDIWIARARCELNRRGIEI